MPPATSTTPATSASHLPLEGLSRVRHLLNPWEEPHPGSRLPPAQSSQGCEKVANNGSYHLNGGRKGGMAAKDFAPFHQNRPWLVRRSIRVRARTNTPAPLKITTEITEDQDAKSAPLPAVRDVPVSSPALPTPIVTPATPEVGVEATETRFNGPAVEEVRPSELPLPASPPVDCQFTDFSNLLGISLQPEEAIAVDTDERESYCHAAPGQDIYGWDAELNRQSKQFSPCDQDYQYRRTSMTKRSLLHRVFSMGPVPKDVDIEVRRASSNSS